MNFKIIIKNLSYPHSKVIDVQKQHYINDLGNNFL